MRIFKHPGHTAYELNKHLVIIKRLDKIQLWFPKKHRPKGARTGWVNARFRVTPHKQFKYFHWTIRLPFFYWMKDNGGFHIGLPNIYLWRIK